MSEGNGIDRIELLEKEIVDLKARISFYEPIAQVLKGQNEIRTMILGTVDINGNAQMYVMGAVGPIELIGLAETTPESVRQALANGAVKQEGPTSKKPNLIMAPSSGRA